MARTSKNGEARGNFVAFANERKTPGDKLPAFVNGKIEVPGKEGEFEFSLWAHTYKDPKTGYGKIVLNGTAEPIAKDAATMDFIKAMAAAKDESTIEMMGLNLKPGQIVLFTNSYKEEAPEKNRPDFWGAYRPVGSKEPVRLSVWSREKGTTKYLSGEVSRFMNDKTIAQMQDSDRAPRDYGRAYDMEAGR